jgi:hypothetical protein
MTRRRALRTGALALATGLLLGACSRPPRPDAGLPEGALLLARRAALVRLLDAAAQLEGTPLARHARRLAGRLPDCAWIEAQAPSAQELADALVCADPAGPLAALERERAGHDLAFALPLRAPARLVGRATVEADGGLAVRLRLPGDALSGPAAFLLPGAEPAGAPLLASGGALLHARVRAARRLDLAAFVSPDGQAAQLFRLRSELFSGLVLDGSWEIAAYLPEPGRVSPRIAVALGVRERRAAVAAMESFLEDLRASWPLRRSDFALGDARGACLPDLNLLPDLAPCYLASERALVAGWNPASLRQALRADAAGPPPAAGAPGALLVDLARIEEADARLRARVPDPAGLLPQQPYPWRRLTLTGERVQGDVELRLRLLAKAPT